MVTDFYQTIYKCFLSADNLQNWITKVDTIKTVTYTFNDSNKPLRFEAFRCHPLILL